MSRKRAVCLLSGGLDSATTLAIALHEGFEVFALSVDYGQLHLREMDSAKMIALYFKVEHVLLKVPMPWKGSSLLDPNIPLSKYSGEETHLIPTSYVPARNTVLIGIAASMAEAKGARSIFIGANAVDYSGYPDCRPEYFKVYQELLRTGMKCGISGDPIEIKTPLLYLSKAEIIKSGIALGVPYELTWSCYAGREEPCGECDSCVLRAKGFKEAGIRDPILSHREFNTKEKCAA